MCGIVGGWLEQPDMAKLRRALGAIGHRGPDAREVCLDEGSGIVLGHARLSIIDLSPTGAQPMHSDDGSVTLVYNGELYNFEEIREELVGKGISFRGTSDTEVILRLFLLEGMAMLPRLNGIFALAIHDRRTGDLLLARDALGVKPLYYSSGEFGVVFSSEMKALQHLASFDRQLDFAALNRYLTYLWCPGDGTPFAAVRKLLPGHALRIRGGKIEEHRSWYALPLQNAPKTMLSEHEAIAEVRRGLQRAVQRQLVADVPVGAFLSGGLDSSAIVAFARKEIGDFRCFTIDAPGGGEEGFPDDLPYARKVADHLGVKLDVVHVDAERMIGDLERLVVQLDEPLADPAALNVLYISELARRNGIKVLLSGSGGDDLFSGYRRHLALTYEKAWSWLPQPARLALGRAAASLDQRSPIVRRLGKMFRNAHETGDVRIASYFAWASDSDIQALYSADMKNSIEGVRSDQPMLDFLATVPASRSPLDRMLALEQRFFLADHNLIYTDKMSMACGVEVRVPFLDLDLIELAARIPDSVKQRGREGKWVLKKAMEAELPHDVIYRRKTGFGAPLHKWIRHELRDFVRDTLSERNLSARGLFDPHSVAALIDDNEAGRRDGTYTIFSLLCVEMWCRAFRDGGNEVDPDVAPVESHRSGVSG